MYYIRKGIMFIFFDDDNENKMVNLKQNDEIISRCH